MDSIHILFGLGVGVVAGLAGVGGGSPMTPLRPLAVGVPPGAGLPVPPTAIVGVARAMGLAARVPHRLRIPAREVVTA